MFLRSTIKYVSYFYLLKLVINKVFSGKLGFLSVFIERGPLFTLSKDPNFKSLLFSSDYDGRPLIKDKVTLLGYVQEDKNGAKMKRFPLKSLNEGEPFDNDKNYSRYELKKEDLEKILGSYGEEAHYFIFKPITYALDREYVAYQIIPADQNRVPLRRRQRGDIQSEQLMNSANDNTGAPSPQTGTVALALRTEFEYEVAGVMNPSPPATNNVEY